MIRPAIPADATEVAALMILSMDHIAGVFAASERYDDAIPFFTDFFLSEHNQYSYRNTLVYEADGIICGSVTGYDGGRLNELRQPVVDKLRQRDPLFTPEDETGPGEYYLDCISVRGDRQGEGIGNAMIDAFCVLAAGAGFAKVGLIVDFANPHARSFYEKRHFQVAGEKVFLGRRYYHMTRTLSDGQ